MLHSVPVIAVRHLDCGDVIRDPNHGVHAAIVLVAVVNLEIFRKGESNNLIREARRILRLIFNFELNIIFSKHIQSSTPTRTRHRIAQVKT